MNISLKTNSRKVDEIIFHENMKFLIVEWMFPSCFFAVTLMHVKISQNTHTHTQVTILGSAENQHPPSMYISFVASAQIILVLKRLNFQQIFFWRTKFCERKWRIFSNIFWKSSIKQCSLWMISTTSPKKFGKKKKKNKKKVVSKTYWMGDGKLSKSLVTLEMKWFSF
jgi:hypothetical protein